MEEDVADPPADDRPGHDPEDDEEQVVTPQVGVGGVEDRRRAGRVRHVGPAGEEGGEEDAEEGRDGEAERLESDGAVADVEQRVEVEHDRRERHSAGQ
jgi:hypothetical protein